MIIVLIMVVIMVVVVVMVMVVSCMSSHVATINSPFFHHQW